MSQVSQSSQSQTDLGLDGFNLRIRTSSQKLADFWKLCNPCTLLFKRHSADSAPSTPKSEDGVQYHDPWGPNYVDPWETDWISHLTLASAIKSAHAGCRLCKLIVQIFDVGGSTNWQTTNFDASSIQIFAQYGRPWTVLTLEARLSTETHKQNLNISELASPKNPELRELCNVLGLRGQKFESIRESTLAQISTWLSNCSTEHPECQSSYRPIPVTKKLPTRLLELKREANHTLVRVVEASGLPLDTNYLTLSHCWGKHTYVALTGKTYVEFSQSIPWNKLPKTFMDAMETTIHLGFCYLWIDSLCIIQDSPSDWAYEASLMAQVYSFSTLNLSATAASDGQGGFFGQEYANFFMFTLEGNGEMIHHICFLPDFWNKDIEESKLCSRGWIVQERILSPRCVHFARGQIYWECRKGAVAEVIPEKFIPGYAISPSTILLSKSPKEIYESWIVVIERYTRCQLTRITDKMMAIAGLARRTCIQLGVSPQEYLAGLWKADLPNQLLWSQYPFPGEEEYVVSRADEVGAPSWSWASIDGPVSYRLTETNPDFHLEILEAATLHNNDPFGLITGGHLLVQAPFCRFGPEVWDLYIDELINEARTDPLYFNVYEDLSSLFHSVTWDDNNLDFEAEPGLPPEQTQPYLLLVRSELDETYAQADGERRTRCNALVLQPTGQSPGQFHRIGIVIKYLPYFGSLLKYCLDPRNVPETVHRGFEPDKGFVIEII